MIVFTHAIYFIRPMPMTCNVDVLATIAMRHDIIVHYDYDCHALLFPSEADALMMLMITDSPLLCVQKFDPMYPYGVPKTSDSNL